MEMTYTVITETKDKSLRKVYWDIALYIKSLDGVKPSNWFSKVIESSMDLKIDCEQIIDKLKEYYNKFDEYELDEKLSKESECDFNSTRIYQIFISGGFNSRPIAPSLVFKHILQDKYSFMGTIRPKDKFIKLLRQKVNFV